MENIILDADLRKYLEIIKKLYKFKDLEIAKKEMSKMAGALYEVIGLTQEYTSVLHTQLDFKYLSKLKDEVARQRRNIDLKRKMLNDKLENIDAIKAELDKIVAEYNIVPTDAPYMPFLLDLKERLIFAQIYLEQGKLPECREVVADFTTLYEEVQKSLAEYGMRLKSIEKGEKLRLCEEFYRYNPLFLMKECSIEQRTTQILQLLKNEYRMMREQYKAKVKAAKAASAKAHDPASTLTTIPAANTPISDSHKGEINSPLIEMWQKNIELFQRLLEIRTESKDIKALLDRMIYWLPIHLDTAKNATASKIDTFKQFLKIAPKEIREGSKPPEFILELAKKLGTEDFSDRTWKKKIKKVKYELALLLKIECQLKILINQCNFKKETLQQEDYNEMLGEAEVMLAMGSLFLDKGNLSKFEEELRNYPKVSKKIKEYYKLVVNASGSALKFSDAAGGYRSSNVGELATVMNLFSEAADISLEKKALKDLEKLNKQYLILREKYLALKKASIRSEATSTSEPVPTASKEESEKSESSDVVKQKKREFR